MRPLVCLVVFLTSLSVRATEFLKNGDFSDGISHWHGNVHSFNEGAQIDVVADKASAPKGMIVELRPGSWTLATQDITTKGADLTVSITVTFSSDTTFSSKNEDYANVTQAIGFTGWGPLSLDVGNWMMMFSDIHAVRGHNGAYFPFKPDLSSKDPFTFTQTVSGFLSDTEKTLTLAFPPGHGTVTVLKASVTDGL